MLEFFETSTRNLLAAEAAAGRRPPRRAVGGGHRAAARERLLPGEDRPGAADREVGDPVLDRARDPVLRVRPEHRGRGHGRRQGPDRARALPAHRRRRRRPGGRPGRGGHAAERPGRDRRARSSSGWTSSSARRWPPGATRARWSPTRTRATSEPSWASGTLVPGDGAILGEIRYRDWPAGPRPERRLASPHPTTKGSHARIDRSPSKPRSTAWQTALTVLQEAEPPFIPAGCPRDDRGHRVPARRPRHAAAPALRPGFRLRAGRRDAAGAGGRAGAGRPRREAFWEPGGDVIHYQDGNNRDDIPLRFTVTMLCEPGKPMLILVDEEELAQRKDRRAPRPS